MKKLAMVAVCLILLVGVVPMGFSRGDKIVPQVAAGGAWSTIFDLTNISSAKSITNMRLAFYQANGTPWVLQTSLGTASTFDLNLAPKETRRVSATGGLATVSGYAVIHDQETENSAYSEDFVLGISVFYQYQTGDGITETISVPVREPTAAVSVQMEVAAPNIYSALAVVNASGGPNTVRLALYNENGSLYGTNSFLMAAGAQRVEFIDQNLFPEFGVQPFKGMAEITADGPLSILSLRQIRAVGNTTQYTLLVPVDRESLRRNSYMVLLQVDDDAKPYLPIDFDAFAVDFYRTTGIDDSLRNPDVPTESYSWDLEYRFRAPDTTDRFLRPVNFAEIAVLGVRNNGEFDAISLPDLKSLATYSTGELDVSNPPDFLTYAVRTDLGHFAKVRIVRVIETTGTDQRVYRDLVLEVVLYK